MAKKPWKQLETDEKLQLLRDDIAQAYKILKCLRSDVDNINKHLNRIDITQGEVATVVESLERELPKARV
jgi:hypothetical protein